MQYLNGDAKVYRFLGIASFFKTPYLCTRNQNSAVMLATPEWIVLCSYSRITRLKSRPQADNRTFLFYPFQLYDI